MTSHGAIHLDMFEWEERGPEDSEHLRGVFLASDPRTGGLASFLRSDNQLVITELRSGLSVRTTSWVGRVNVGNLVVTIRPKIDNAPLLRLLRYAYGLRELRMFEQTSFATETHTFQDILIYQLAEEARELVLRGLHRRYLRTHESLTSPRGKIDLQVLARTGAMGSALPCTHYPRLENCLVNQVLLAGIILGASLTRCMELPSRLCRLAGLMRLNVAPSRLNSDTLKRVRFESNRLTAAYQPALRLIEILVGSEGMSVETMSVNLGANGFLFDMNRFFQDLLQRFLTENLQGWSVRGQYSIHDVFAFEPRYNPHKSRAPIVRPDYVIFRGPRPVAVLDAKYRDLWAKGLTEDMRYQLTVYALTHESMGSATILYPTSQPDAAEERLSVRIPATMARRAYICLRPVNLAYLDSLIAASGKPSVKREAKAFAQYLAFGSATN